MKIKEGGNFIPAPEGMHNAVCVDIVELHDVQTMWGTKDLIRVVWEIDAKMESGKPFLVNQRYTPSLNSKATLRKHLKSWRGRDFTKEELDGFELDSIIGASCQIVIIHNEGKDGNTYANISAILKAKDKLEASGNYIRVKDREDKGEYKPQRKSQKEEMEDEEGEDMIGDNKGPF